MLFVLLWFAHSLTMCVGPSLERQQSGLDLGFMGETQWMRVLYALS